MASPSKNKGKAGERELAKILESIFEGPFQRVFSSGAFVGGSNAYRRQTLSNVGLRSAKADIIPPDFMSKLVIECKSYRGFPWHQLLRDGYVKILEGKDGWIQQTLDAVDDGDVWFLCMKFNNIGWFVLYDGTVLQNKSQVVGLNTSYDMPNMIRWKNYSITDLVSFFTKYKIEIKTICL